MAKESPPENSTQENGPPPPATWSRGTKRNVTIALVVVVLFLIYISRPVMSYLVMAMIIAFLLNPIIDFLVSRARFPRILATIVVYLLLLSALPLIPLIFVPSLINEVRDIDIDEVQLAENLAGQTVSYLQTYRHMDLWGFSVDLSNTVDPAIAVLSGELPGGFIPSLGNVVNSLPDAVSIVTSLARNLTGTVSSIILAFILTLVYAFYISLDVPLFEKKLRELVPVQYHSEYTLLLRRVAKVWGAYFRGQIELCFIIGFMAWIGGTLVGLPGALVLGIVAGVMELIPNLGATLGAIPAVTVALVSGSETLPVSKPVFALIVVGIYMLIQQVENNLIVPRVIGTAVDVHPLLIMVAMVVGASTAGILGVLLAAPFVATGKVILVYVYDKLLDRDPYPHLLPRKRPKKPRKESSLRNTLQKAAKKLRGK